MITDEQFDAAWKAYKGHDLRAALEAIAPELLAQGMEKAADLVQDCGRGPSLVIEALTAAIRASAAQLREGKG